MVSAGLARDCARFSGGRYAAAGAQAIADSATTRADLHAAGLLPSAMRRLGAVRLFLISHPAAKRYRKWHESGDTKAGFHFLFARFRRA